MIDEDIQTDTFTLPFNTLLANVRKSLNQLLETLKSQFAQDETGIGTTDLRKCKLTQTTQNLLNKNGSAENKVKSL